jgi:hypothetical protein
MHTNEEEKMNSLNKILLTVLILLFFTLALLNASTISLSERHGPSGSVVQIPLNYKDAENVAGGEFLIQYDPSLLEFMSVTLSSFSEGFILSSQIEDNKVAITLASATGLPLTKGILVNLNFRIRLSAQTGTSTELTVITANLYNVNGDLIDVTVEHGLLKVSEIVVYPNPITPNDDGFNDVANFVVPDSISGNVTVNLYSISGGKVAEISGADNSVLQWNGESESGQALRPGPYMYILQSEGNTLSQGTITVMR